MRDTTFATLAALAAMSVMFASAPADARHDHGRRRVAATPWTLGVLPAGPGAYYGPHYGYPTYPSYWYGPTTGVYAVDPSLCLAPRASPGWLWWHWHLENVC
jgi:hypothetical protein